MNRQKRLIRCVCAVGIAGMLAVGAIAGGQDKPYTVRMDAKRYDGAAEELKVFEGEQDASETAWDFEDSADAGQIENAGSPADPVSPEESVDSTGQGEVTSPAESMDPETPEEPAVPENPEGSETPEGSAVPEEPTVPEESTIPEGSAVPENPGISETPEEPAVPENPGISEMPEEPTEPGTPVDPGESTNPDKTAGTENLENPGEPSDVVLPSFPMLPGIDEMSRDADELKPENMIPERISNASLIMNQKLVKLPKIIEDFRFWTVARKYAFAREDMVIREAVLADEGMEGSVRAVGRLSGNGLLFILKEEDHGWFYVESGRVRGFVRSEEVITGEEAVPILEAYQNEARIEAEKEQAEYAGIEGVAPVAVETVPWRENQAFVYLRATAGQTVVEKEYAIAKAETAVREDKNEASRMVGVLPEGGLSCILEDKEQDWVFIESGDVRGFVRKECLRYEESVTEENFLKAKELVKPEENGACYYTLTSTEPGVPDGELRRSVIEFAAQFVGNPYVWGGTSLTQGADCSGFVQSIYKQYGYDIPRVARDQAQYGTQIPVEDALPGDLIFYARDGVIHHVVMYAGDGRTIEAMSSDTGIVQADVRKDGAVWATRILKDESFGYAGGGIGNVNAAPDMYGKDLGTFKLTYYCACELCCDVETGITATGAPVVEGRTIAVDPSVIPYGTQVIIGGHVFTAEDCGGAIKENHIDIYVNDHETAKALGVNYAEVYLKK